MIAFQSVSKIFQRRAVLNDVSLTLARGNKVALVGSNGAGKTTLIRCLLGEYVCQGAVTVDGIDPRQDRQAVLARIGFVPQMAPPLKIPVGELINFAASVCQSDPLRMERVAGELGLDMDVIRTQPFVKLSGGQKQKLLIGIALGRDTDILVMDEPAASLDPESRKIFFNLLAHRPKETVMLMSSHRIDEIAALVNRVVELDRGKVVLDDHVADTVDPSAVQACTLRLARAEDALAKSLSEWGFAKGADALTWSGTVAGPDRLRFFAMMSRYAGLISSLELK